MKAYLRSDLQSTNYHNIVKIKFQYYKLIPCCDLHNLLFKLGTVKQGESLNVNCITGQYYVIVISEMYSIHITIMHYKRI